MTIEKSVVVPLSPDETFALVTEPERLRRWQAVTARIDLRAGGEYRWTIVPGHTAAGNVLEVEPGKRVVFSWGWEGDADLPPGTSQLTITLEPSGGGTLVRLLHEGLTTEQEAGHDAGWDHFVERLAKAAEGDAGPDEWAAAPNPMDQLSAAEAALAVCQRILKTLVPADATSATPCKKFTVNDLIDHLIDSLVRLGGAGGGTVEDTKDDDAEARVAGAADQALEAWRRRGLEGTVDFGGREMPATFPASILSLELLVHAWDVAQVTGAPLEVSDELANYVLGLAHDLISPEARDGDRFGGEVVPDAGATPLEKLAAFTGRSV